MLRSIYRHASQFLTCALLVFGALSASAEMNQELHHYVDSLVDKATNILHDNKLSENQKVEQCRALLRANLDLEWMAKYSLGRYRKSVSKEQVDNFVHVYSDYVVKAYSDLVKNYQGEKAVVKNVRQLDEDEYIVQTEVVRTNGGAPIKADYLVRDKGFSQGHKDFKVSDVITEGVSMINSQQSEFGSIIANNGFDVLIKELTKKTSDVKTK